MFRQFLTPDDMVLDSSLLGEAVVAFVGVAGAG